MRKPCNLFLLVTLAAYPALAQIGALAAKSDTHDPKVATPLLDSRCMAGQWHEQLDNPFRWIFQVRGDRLKIWRTDRFVVGKFRREGDIWKGELKWGNGETWRNVELTPTCGCDEVHTNQPWWFKRS